jgi:hypothetical protein
MSGIYVSLRQAQITILEILNVWMPVPLYLSGVVIIFAFLDLGKNISFSNTLLDMRLCPTILSQGVIGAVWFLSNDGGL